VLELAASVLAIIRRCSQSEMAAHIIRSGRMPKAGSFHGPDRPISPSPTGHFGNEQSGTYFGKTAISLPSVAPCDRQPSRWLFPFEKVEPAGIDPNTSPDDPFAGSGTSRRSS